MSKLTSFLTVASVLLLILLYEAAHSAQVTSLQESGKPYEVVGVQSGKSLHMPIAKTQA